MKKLVIIGTKEFAFQIRDFAQQLNQFELVGYIDDVLPIGTDVEGKKVLGAVSDAISLYQQHLFDCIFPQSYLNVQTLFLILHRNKLVSCSLKY